MSPADWKPSLFLVDDEPEQVFLIELAAQRSGEFRSVRATVDSHLAYHQLVESAGDPQRRPDVVIIDWKMSRLHGSELAAAIQAHDDLKGIPVIILSNSDVELDRQQALEAGCKAFFQKPETFSRLIELLREIRRQFCFQASLSV